MTLSEAVDAGHKAGKVVRDVAPFDWKVGVSGKTTQVEVNYHNHDDTTHKVVFTAEQVSEIPLGKVETAVS